MQAPKKDGYLNLEELQGIVAHFVGTDIIDRIDEYCDWDDFNNFAEHILKQHKELIETNGDDSIQNFQKQIATSNQAIDAFLKAVKGPDGVSIEKYLGFKESISINLLLHNYQMGLLINAIFYINRLIVNESDNKIVRNLRDKK
jgi:hypothetical protein